MGHFLWDGPYVLSQMLVAGIELHRIPAYTSIFLWSLLALAACVGLFYKDRAFCRGFCPVGLLLATYGRGSMLAARCKVATTCDACPGKDCVQSCNRSRRDARSCPSLLNPAKLNDGVDCLVCGQCMKVCPHSNMGLYLRRPFHPGDARQPMAPWPVALFVMLVSGFVCYELFSEWKAAKAVFLWMPEAAAAAIPGEAGEAWAGWIQGAWTLFVVPMLLWLVLGGLVRVFRGAGSLGEACRKLALPMAIVIAGGHMAKGLAKVVSWGGYLPYALKEPKGIETAAAMASGGIAKPTPYVSLTLVSLFVLALLAATGFFALRESRLADPVGHGSRVASLLLATLASGFLVFGWGFLG